MGVHLESTFIEFRFLELIQIFLQILSQPADMNPVHKGMMDLDRKRQQGLSILVGIFSPVK